MTVGMLGADDRARPAAGARRGTLSRLAVVAVALVAVAVPPPAAAAPARTLTYSVTSQGVTGDLGHVAAVAHSTLNDHRGWGLGGAVAWHRVASGGNLVVVLASGSVIAAAAPVCSASWSCRVGNRVYLHERNWRLGTAAWTEGVEEYQRYVLNHEVGHFLGMGHTSCPGGGRSAAVMQQQSISLQGCLANVWPLIPEREAAARYLGVAAGWTAVDHVYRGFGQDRGLLGPPVTWERPTADGVGRYQHYQRGSVFWHPTTGAWEVHGLVRQRWIQVGADLGPLGYPTSHETAPADGVGRYSAFRGYGGPGAVFYHPALGAHEVYGAVYRRWAQLRREQGPLGYPTTGERPTADGTGRYNDFAGNGGGTIVWTPATGVQEVYGAVRARWHALGRERGPLGHPTTGERTTADGRGRYNDFQRGTVVWTPSTGAREVYGAIWAAWDAAGRDLGPLGQPLSGEYDVPGGRRSDFEGGTVTYTHATGQATVDLRAAAP
jgi:hypothetical protein